MRNRALLKLIVGFRKFRERYFLQESQIYTRLSTSGQTPKTLMIGCSDSRVDPAILTSASPGELFVIRNVANLVPPYEGPGSGYHGISSAIEFAVVNLKVENVIILGHRQCGGIRSLMTGGTPDPNSFVGHWMQIAEPAKQQVLNKHPHADDDTICRACEMVSIGISLRNLKTFPFVQNAVKERGLTLVGAYFDLEQGQLFAYNEESEEFKVVEV